MSLLGSLLGHFGGDRKSLFLSHLSLIFSGFREVLAGPQDRNDSASKSEHANLLDLEISFTLLCSSTSIKTLLTTCMSDKRGHSDFKLAGARSMNIFLCHSPLDKKGKWSRNRTGENRTDENRTDENRTGEPSKG